MAKQRRSSPDVQCSWMLNNLQGDWVYGKVEQLKGLVNVGT